MDLLDHEDQTDQMEVQDLADQLVHSVLPDPRAEQDLEDRHQIHQGLPAPQGLRDQWDPLANRVLTERLAFLVQLAQAARQAR